MLKKTPALATQPCTTSSLLLEAMLLELDFPVVPVLLPNHYRILQGSKQAIKEISRLPHHKAHFVH